jgi:hypothetical protein
MAKKSRSMKGPTSEPKQDAPSESIALEVIDPTPREFEARPCSSCQAIRPHGKNYSRVYCTRGTIRYCKCHFCGHTWAQESK